MKADMEKTRIMNNMQLLWLWHGLQLFLCEVHSDSEENSWSVTGLFGTEQTAEHYTNNTTQLTCVAALKQMN
jgi:hypothetical protein